MMINLHDMRKGIAAAKSKPVKGPHSRRALRMVQSSYEDQALPSNLGEGPAENFGVEALIPLVLNLLSTMCPGLGGVLPPASNTAKAMKYPTAIQDAQHWRTCVRAARQEIVDTEIGAGKPGKGKHLKTARKDWRRRQRVLRAELIEAQDDAALRTYHANNKTAETSSLAELTALVEERRAAV